MPRQCPQTLPAFPLSQLQIPLPLASQRSKTNSQHHLTATPPLHLPSLQPQKPRLPAQLQNSPAIILSRRPLLPPQPALLPPKPMQPSHAYLQAAEQRLQSLPLQLLQHLRLRSSQPAQQSQAAASALSASRFSWPPSYLQPGDKRCASWPPPPCSPPPKKTPPPIPPERKNAPRAAQSSRLACRNARNAGSRWQKCSTLSALPAASTLLSESASARNASSISRHHHHYRPRQSTGARAAAMLRIITCFPALPAECGLSNPESM